MKAFRDDGVPVPARVRRRLGHRREVTVECHHHEVAPMQCEIDIRYSTMLGTADNLQLFKYVVRNTAYQYGTAATFMPNSVETEVAATATASALPPWPLSSMARRKPQRWAERRTPRSTAAKAS